MVSCDVSKDAPAASLCTLDPQTIQNASMVGRFAPTPSGRMHLGNVASCLVAWLSVRAQQGKMVLRIEDLDPRAHNPEAALLIMDDLTWLGLNWDEGPFYQSERSELYLDAIGHLREKGLTYPCFCTRGQLHAVTAPHASDGTYVYAGTCRNLSTQEVATRSLERQPALRLRVPNYNSPAAVVAFKDLTFGLISENLASECGDFLIQRSDGVIAYQLAVVVDDALMGISEVVRGRDLLGSVARQMYLQNALGYKHPAYGHIPLLIAPDGKRLSKRERSLDLGELRTRYSSPEPLLGTLAYHLGLINNNEPINAKELIKYFAWNKLAANHADIVVDESFLP